MKKKMFIAGMSLAVALVLMATATFAWITISVAPEVEGMEMALYANRTLLLAPGDGTNTAPASDEFKQYISLSDNFRGLSALRPVSTADGINWFLPAYSSEDGGIAAEDEFILDSTLEHGNVSLLDTEGSLLTGDALHEASSKGYYVYTDIWMKTEESGAKVRLSIPSSYGDTTERHSGTVTEYGLEEQELENAVYGTYVLGEPELDEEDPSKLKTRTEEPETALRVGFLVYQDTETLEPVLTGVDARGIPDDTVSLPFKIYEPNADKRAAGTAQELLIPDTEGNSTVSREDYIVGSTVTSLSDNTYYVTQPIGKDGDGIALTTVSEEDMIIQLHSEWENSSVIKSLNGQWGNSILKANSNDVKTFGQFLKVNSSFSEANGTVLLTDTTGMTDIAGSNVIVELKKDTPIRVRLFVWLEGQDVDCWNDIAAGTFRINLELAGETVYTEEEEETEPQPVLACTLKGYGTDGSSSDGWFNSTAAGISRSQITELEFTKTAPTADIAATWNAGTGTDAEAITAYRQGTKITIVVPAGADKIKLPEDSSGLFRDLTACTSITGLNLADTSDVTSMKNMFSSCSNIAAIDISGFDTAAVTDTMYMFDGGYRLTTIYASDSWSTASVTSSNFMFRACTALVGGNGTKFNSVRHDAAYARIDTASTPGYFTQKTAD